ncbi:MAG: MOSC domain-containing protein [Spirochaetaceae bacterium]|jgi:molybdenum cofactor synthesis domain-containing protein|nr:MOSC domain-containing protein [Spirochaetaceae bacterium]
MAKVMAVCLSEKKGTPKQNVFSALFITGHGAWGDAHAGNWHRQVSLLSLQKIEDFRAKGAQAEFGAFGENIVVDGVDLASLPVGTHLKVGEAVLEITQIGKECQKPCAIFKRMGECIMPSQGVFARVLKGGRISCGDEVFIQEAVKPGPDAEKKETPYRAAILISSDKCFSKEREDASGPVIRALLADAGYDVCVCDILPDEKPLLEAALIRFCDELKADLVVTSGGTGFSPRDCTPEASVAVAERLAPGIAEAMRAASLAVTKRAMLSRGVAAIRGKTLIINLPGSPKAAKENLSFVITELKHGLDILTGRAGECAQI